MLVVDATEEEELRARLQNELDNMADRHDAGVAIYEKAAGYAPAFGMIGTLVGLVSGCARGKFPGCGYVRGSGYYLLRLYYSKSFDVSHSQEAAYPQRRGDAVPYDYDGGYYLHSGR